MKLRSGLLMVVLAFPTISAHAAALSRTDQNVDYLFESGNNATVGVAVVSPSVKGTDLAEGSATGNVAENFTPVNASVKYQLNDQLALALGYDQPFGIDVKYNPTPYNMSPTSAMQAHAKVHALTALVGYKTAQNLDYVHIML